MNNAIAVVILNYRSWQDTLKEISICNSILNIAYEDIIVIDNASPNESAKELLNESAKKRFVFLQSKENRGYATGNNIGLRYAYNKNYKYALILNNDILISDVEMIPKILNVFSEDSQIAVVNPDIISPNGYVFNRDAKRPSLYDFTFGAVAYKKIGRCIKDMGGYSYVYRPQGCCMMVDLGKINSVDYMDEHTFLYYEESILAERLLKRKYRCAVCTNLQVIHNHSATVKSVFSKRRRIRIINNSFRYYLKEYRKFNFFQVKFCCLFNCFKVIAE